MLPIDPGDGQGSVTPARPVEDIVPLRDMMPAQAMSRGGTIIRPGAVAWGGMRDSTDSGYSSCEAIERILASVAADPGQLPDLLTELSTTRLWVPLPARHRPFTDGTAVRLPLIEAEGEDFVPCFTSVQRLTAWVDAADLPRAAPSEEFQFAESGRRWQRAGDARVVPHLVVPAVGLARRLPSGLGLALNADGANGLPLYPESVSYLARLADPRDTPHRGRGRSRAPAGRAEGPARRGAGRPAGAAVRPVRVPCLAVGPRRGRGPGHLGRPRRPGKRGAPRRRDRRAGTRLRRRSAPRPLPGRRHLPRRDPQRRDLPSVPPPTSPPPP